MFKNVIFDLDGTLLDTLQDLANASNYALTKMGLPVHSLDAYKKFVGNGRTVLCRRMLPIEMQNTKNIETAVSFFDSYYEKHKTDNTKPYAGIFEMLTILNKNDIKCAVVTNKPHQFAVPCVQQFFGSLITAVQGSCAALQPKPAPDGVLKILTVLNAGAKDTLYVGDSNVDIFTAANVPMLKSCGVLWGFRSELELKCAGADFLAATPQKLCEIVLS